MDPKVQHILMIAAFVFLGIAGLVVVGGFVTAIVHLVGRIVIWCNRGEPGEVYEVVDGDSSINRE